MTVRCLTQLLLPVRRLARALLALVGLVGMGTAASAADPAPEDVVKAAVVFKLTKFVDWPDEIFESADSPLRMCVVGDTPVTNALSVVEGRVTRGRPVELVEVNRVSAEDGCHLLFVGARKVSRSVLAAEAEQTLPLLTVSDSEDFAERGGIVELTRRGARLGFRVNVANARRAGLVISAPLLELAEIVE